MINARVTFEKDNLKQIKIAAAFEGKTQKQFMEDAIVSAAIMTINKAKKK